MDENQPVPDHVNQKLFVMAISTIIVALIIAAVGVATYHHYHHNAPVPTANNVPIQDSITPTGFVPATIEINKGQSIVWTNYDTKVHTVSSDPYPKDNALLGFKSDPFSNSQTYSFVFDQKGTYSYHDDLNPSTFKGTIIVK
jgi:plastocyanin